MSEKTVSDLMHKGVIACKPETPMNEAVRIVSDTDVHAIIVMDENNQALGIISHTDIIRLFGKDLSQHIASEIMSSPVQDIAPDQTAAAAAKLMLEKDIHRLLVVEQDGDKKKAVGIISTTDLVKEMRGSRWVWYMG